MAIVFPKLQERTIETHALRETLSNLEMLAQNLSNAGEEGQRLLNGLLVEIKTIELGAKGKKLIKDDGTPRRLKQGKYEEYLTPLLGELYKKYEQQIYPKKKD